MSADTFDVASADYRLAGQVTYAHTSGAYLVQTRGGSVSGRAPDWPTLARHLTVRHGYVIGETRTVSLPGCAETVTDARVFELDWSLAP